MPAFLMFEEFGLDPDSMPGPLLGLAKAGLRMVPMSWAMHGIIGEYNVDVDPIGELRETLDGGGTLGSMANNLEKGNVIGALTEFSEGYKGWITVTGITVPSSVKTWDMPSFLPRMPIVIRTSLGCGSLGDRHRS